jgi:hypothetical protein
MLYVNLILICVLLLTVQSHPLSALQLEEMAQSFMNQVVRARADGTNKEMKKLTNMLSSDFKSCFINCTTLLDGPKPLTTLLEAGRKLFPDGKFGVYDSVVNGRVISFSFVELGGFACDGEQFRIVGRGILGFNEQNKVDFFERLFDYHDAEDIMLRIQKCDLSLSGKMLSIAGNLGLTNGEYIRQRVRELNRLVLESVTQIDWNIFGQELREDVVWCDALNDTHTCIVGRQEAVDRLNSFAEIRRNSGSTTYVADDGFYVMSGNGAAFSAIWVSGIPNDPDEIIVRTRGFYSFDTTTFPWKIARVHRILDGRDEKKVMEKLSAFVTQKSEL